MICLHAVALRIKREIERLTRGNNAKIAVHSMVHVSFRKDHEQKSSRTLHLSRKKCRRNERGSNYFQTVWAPNGWAHYHTVAGVASINKSAISSGAREYRADGVLSNVTHCWISCYIPFDLQHAVLISHKYLVNIAFVPNRIFSRQEILESFIHLAARQAKRTKRSPIIRPTHSDHVFLRGRNGWWRAISNSFGLKGPRGSGVVGPFGCPLHRCRRAVTYPGRQRVRIRVKANLSAR